MTWIAPLSPSESDAQAGGEHEFRLYRLTEVGQEGVATFPPPPTTLNLMTIPWVIERSPALLGVWT